MFYDREDAGLMLAEKLSHYRNQSAVVLAVPRGGVPVGDVVARQLGLPLQLVLTRKIGHPLNKEYAIGAADLQGYFKTAGGEVPEAYFQQESARVQERLREMKQLFMKDMPEVPLQGKILIMVDDGIATGSTLKAAAQLLRKAAPAKLVIAAPLAPPEAVRKLSAVADEVVVVLMPQDFVGVGAFYQQFPQVSDEEIIALMQKWHPAGNAGERPKSP